MSKNGPRGAPIRIQEERGTMKIIFRNNIVTALLTLALSAAPALAENENHFPNQAVAPAKSSAAARRPIVYIDAPPQAPSDSRLSALAWHTVSERESPDGLRTMQVRFTAQIDLLPQRDESPGQLFQAAIRALGPLLDTPAFRAHLKRPSI